MKLCRFELKASPGEARSGLVFGGKIYETDGANPVAVHEAIDVRPLSPIPHAPSLRIFHNDFQPAMLVGDEAEEPYYFYGNPTHLLGASQLLPFPEWCAELSVFPAVAAVLVSDIAQIDLAEADDTILGYTLVNLLVARDMEGRERRVGIVGRAYDLSGVIGPVLTTPDELEDEVEDEEFGRRYALMASLRVNGVERGRGSTDEVPITFAQAIVAAAQSGPLRAGDLLVLGPIVDTEEPIVLEPGDEVSLAVDKLGTLSLKLSLSQ